MNMDLNAIIEEITREVIKRLEKTGERDIALPGVLIPLSYGPITWQESCSHVRELLGENNFTSLLLADGRDQVNVEKELGKGLVQFYICNEVNKLSCEVFSNTKLVVVPVFSPYNLGRVATLTPLLLVEWIILDALQRGIKVIIGKDEFYPGSSLRKSAGLDKAPAPFNDLIKSYMDRLSSWGIKFVELVHLFEAVQSEFKPKENPKTLQTPSVRQVITKEDILLFSSSGNKVIELSPGSIITPLAKDIAKERGIDLKFKV
ncbi:MAG: hypothetical protein BWY64_01330 [bacterium ADurb.Bin363]|nr:MAG: hypothetical protein BWY64_01330 [bacterium ADurb.Bin363]